MAETVKAPLTRIKEWTIANKRSLTVLTSMVLFFVINDIVYKHILNDANSWSNLDVIYYVVTTVTTVGYGDYYPTSNAGKIYTIFFILTGLFVVFGGFSELITDKLEVIEKFWITRFNRFLPHQETEETYRVWKIIYTLLLIIFTIAIGTLFMEFVEENGFVDSVYWAFVTTTTVGYGDILPKTNLGKEFCIVYMLASVIVIGSAIANFTEISVDIAQENKRTELFNNLNVMKMLEDNYGKIKTDGNFEVDKANFLAFMLVETLGIDREDIDPILEKFDHLDSNNSGSLDKEDIAKWASLQNDNNHEFAQVSVWDGLPVVINAFAQRFCPCLITESAKKYISKKEKMAHKMNSNHGNKIYIGNSMKVDVGSIELGGGGRFGGVAIVPVTNDDDVLV